MTTSKNLLSHKVNNYLLTYAEDIKVEIYDSKCYHGIIFYIGEHRYDVVNNYHMGCRLIIHNEDGWKDIPFKPGTFGFLPDGIEAIEL
jgi:hypothetical protein